MSPVRIGLLDHMGYGNLGDAATQDVLIGSIKERMPDAVIIGFSLNPNDTSERHNIVCYPINWWHPGLWNKVSDDAGAAHTPRGGRSGRLRSVLKKIPVLYPLAWRARYLAQEVAHLGRTFRVLRSLDSLIFAGGGQLGELWLGPWAHPYNVFKFSLLAKLANRKLLFINVGAGPLNRTLSQVFVKCSLRLADYVSFRDVESETLVRRLGVKSKVHVFPDSVYALDVAGHSRRNGRRDAKPLVGLNPIGFGDPRTWPRKDQAAYTRYLDAITRFSLWLLARNYDVRIFSAESSVDLYAIADLRERLLKSVTPAEVDEMFKPLSRNVKDLVAEMSGFDYVVTSKFHGVVFSHMLAKPVIALSYHNKIDDLMRTAGHDHYCLRIEDFDDESLKSAFTSLVGNSQDLKARFRRAASSRRELLKAQFDEVLIPEYLQLHVGSKSGCPSSSQVA